MPTSVQNVPFHSSTDADFRVWGKAVSDGIAAVGLVKVPDTGSVNWETALRPTMLNGIGGFEIWRFDDALQATAPVFIKIEYGTASSTGMSLPGIWVTLSRGTDGSGTPTDVLAPRRLTHSYSSSDATSVLSSIEPLYFSSDGSSLCFSARIGAAPASNTHLPAFVIDRSRDGAGTPTATGGVIFVEGAGAAGGTTGASFMIPAQMHAWTYSGESTMGDAPAAVPKEINGVVLNGASTLANGDRGLVFPYVVTVPGHDPWQVLAACAVVGADAPNGPFTANVLGRVRNYRSIPIGGAHNRWMAGTATGHSGLCILWEG